MSVIQTVFVLEGTRKQPTQTVIQARKTVEQFHSRRETRATLLKELDSKAKSLFDRIHYVEMPDGLREYIVASLLEQGQIIDELSEVN